MTVKECYEKVGSDYQGILNRFGNEEMVERFALKFLQDDSFRTLEEQLQEGNVEGAFRAAHTLKGLCVNLGFDALYEVSSELTELLRAGSMEGYEPLFEQVKQRYGELVEALEELKASAE